MGFGEIKIDNQIYRKDVIIFPDRVQSNWWRAAGHSLSMADLTTVLEKPPEVLVLGQGAFGRMSVPKTVQTQLERRGIQVFTHATKAACDLYNQIRETKIVVAALHLTC